MNYTSIHFLVLLFSVPTLVLGQGNPTRITITNPTDLDRAETVVAVDWKAILQKNPAIDTANVKLINQDTKAEVPFQLAHGGEKTVQHLLLLVSVPARNRVVVTLEKGKPKPVPARTFARYVPERLDDFAWENDKIAFRMYGKALEKTQGDAYGMDVWVKRTDKLVLNDRYKRGKYHVDIGDGMDYYHVGHTLGAGNVAPYVADSVYYSGNYHRWKILDNGPLRTTFRLEYDAWDVAGKMVTATKTITLDAGMQMNRVEARYTFAAGDTLPVVVGIIKRPEPGTMMLNEQDGLMAYWEPQHGEDGITGVGTVLLTPVQSMRVRSDQLLARTTARNGEPFIYYTGAAWNKAGIITNAPAWFAFLQTFKEQIANPLTSSVQ